MKNKILLLLILGFAVTSCEKAITIKPENSVTFANGMDSEKELDSGINAIIYYLRYQRTWNVSYPESRGAFGDMVDTYWLSYQNLDDDSAHEDTFQYAYKAIAQANVLLQSIDDIDLPEDRYNYYMGTIAFYKAYAYKLITQKFGDCILIKDKALFGGAAKSSMCDLVDYAIDQAKLAADLLPDYPDATDSNGGHSLEKTAASKGAANALLAELCLWQAGTKWFAPEDKKTGINETELLETAEQACTDVIESGIYSFDASIKTLCSQTLVEGNTTATIFKIPHRGFTTDLSNFYHRHSLAAQFVVSYPVRKDKSAQDLQYYDFQLSSDLAKSMFEEGDERREEFFYKLDNPNIFPDTILSINPGWPDFGIPPDTTWGPNPRTMLTNIAYPYKFREGRHEILAGLNLNEYKDLDQEIIVYRFAQVYLMRAEARAKLEKTNLAVDDINTVRAKAGALNIDLVEYENNALLATFWEFDREMLYEQGRYARIIRFGEEYIKRFLKGKFKTLSAEDARDGAMFDMLDHQAFEENPLLRQNTYWLRRQ